MKSLIHFKHLLCKALEWLVIFSMAFMVLILLWQILMGLASNFMTIPSAFSAWTIEGATALLVWSGLFGAAVGFARKSHLGIDFFVEKLDADSKAVTAVITHLLTITFIGYVFVWGGIELFKVTDEILPGMQASGWDFNLAWVYLALPVSGCFMLLFSVENLIEVFVDKEVVEQDLKEETSDIELDMEEV